MTLTLKAAGLTCLSFIGALAYLVHLVPRPVEELEAPLVNRGGAGVAYEYAVARARDDKLNGRFQREAAVDADRKDGFEQAAVLVSADEIASKLVSAAANEYMPAAPVVYRELLPAPVAIEPPAYAAADEPEYYEEQYEETEEVFAAASPVAHDSNRPRMLAALRPTETVQASDVYEQSAVRQYTVQNGDTLYRIMQRCWKRTDAKALQALVAANPDLKNRKNKIFPGEILNIPSPDASQSGVRMVGHPESSRRGAAGDNNGVAYSWYTVKSKDSLASIARKRLNDSERWREIAELNQIVNVDRIMPGVKLKLPPPSTDI